MKMFVTVLDKPIVAKLVGSGAMKGNSKPDVLDRISMPGCEINRDRPCVARLDGLSETELELVRTSLQIGGAPVVLTGAGVVLLSEHQQVVRQSRRRAASG